MIEPEPPSPPPSPPSAQQARPPERRVPEGVVSWAITGINVAVFVAMELAGGSMNTRNLVRFGANFAPFVAQGEYWRLLTSAFIHIGLPHLLFNSFALLSFGRLAEGVFGHSRFMAIYVVSAVTGGLLSYLFNRGLSAGASGAIFGVATALVIFNYRNRSAFRVLGGSGLGGIVFILIINAVFGITQPGIDNWGHAGGALGGAVLAAWLTPRVVLLHDQEGNVVGVRWRPSPPSSWAIVPIVLAIVGIVLRIH